MPTLSAHVMTGSSQPSVAIIGAGPGGLASALLLAKSGVDVTVFERSGAVGGRNKVFERDGFKFDLGPTFFHSVSYTHLTLPTKRIV